MFIKCRCVIHITTCVLFQVRIYGLLISLSHFLYLSLSISPSLYTNYTITLLYLTYKVSLQNVFIDTRGVSLQNIQLYRVITNSYKLFIFVNIMWFYKRFFQIVTFLQRIKWVTWLLNNPVPTSCV